MYEEEKDQHVTYRAVINVFEGSRTFAFFGLAATRVFDGAIVGWVVTIVLVWGTSFGGAGIDRPAL